MKFLIDMSSQVRKFASACAILVLLLVATGCDTLPKPDVAPPSEGQSDPPPVAGPDKIQVGDMLKISFNGPTTGNIPDYEDRVPEKGVITLPQIGEVEVVKKDRIELQNEIHDLYVPEYYKYLTVTITMDQRFFYVKGAVKKPDRHFYAGEMTVVRAIAVAGDFTPFAAKNRVKLIHKDGSIEIIDCEKAVKNPSKYDVQVLPGDTIEVPETIF